LPGTGGSVGIRLDKQSISSGIARAEALGDKVEFNFECLFTFTPKKLYEETFLDNSQPWILSSYVFFDDKTNPDEGFNATFREFEGLEFTVHQEKRRDGMIEVKNFIFPVTASKKK